MMIRYYFLFLLFSIVVFSLPVSSYQGMSYGFDTDVLMGLGDETPDGDDQDEVIEAFQAQFIKTAFLEPVFSNRMRFYSDSESSTGGMESTMFDELMMKELSNYLAKEDAFGLKVVLQKDLPANDYE